jgi:hypothetical protein
MVAGSSRLRGAAVCLLSQVDTLGHTVSDLVPLAWWECMEASRSSSPSYDATLKFATALVQDGLTRVTVLIPRSPGALVRARLAARTAGVTLTVDEVGSLSITLRFSAAQAA